MEKIIILKQWFADNKDINNVITVTIKRETEKAYQVFINDLSVIEWIPKSVIEKIVEKDEVMNIIRNLGAFSPLSIGSLSVTDLICSYRSANSGISG